jgi:hypothetical protein
MAEIEVRVVVVPDGDQSERSPGAGALEYFRLKQPWPARHSDIQRAIG